jgi:hypothetical protein
MPGGRGGDTPVDRLMDEARATVSRGARELCCLLNGDAASFERAADHLRRTTGVRVGAELLRQVVEGEGRHVLGCRDDGRLRPAWGAGDCRAGDCRAGDCRAADAVTRQYLGCDGFTARLVTDAEKRRRRGTVRRKRRQKRRLGAGCEPLPPKPLPRRRRGADQSFKEFKLVTFYDEGGGHRLVSVTRRDHHAAGRLMRRDGGRCGFFDAGQKLAVIDGGPWIINQVRRQSLPVDAVCLDFYHLAENVHRARRACFGEEDPAGHARAAGLLHAAKHRGYEDLRDQLVAWRATLRSPPKRRAAELLINYVTDRREMIDYPRFLKEGWQIGSGPTESQCKQVPRRVKGRGKRWDADNAEAVMALEAMRQSGLSDAYWKTCARALN